MAALREISQNARRHRPHPRPPARPPRRVPTSSAMSSLRLLPALAVGLALLAGACAPAPDPLPGDSAATAASPATTAAPPTASAATQSRPPRLLRPRPPPPRPLLDRSCGRRTRVHSARYPDPRQYPGPVPPRRRPGGRGPRHRRDARHADHADRVRRRPIVCAGRGCEGRNLAGRLRGGLRQRRLHAPRLGPHRRPGPFHDAHHRARRVPGPHGAHPRQGHPARRRHADVAAVLPRQHGERRGRHLRSVAGP